MFVRRKSFNLDTGKKPVKANKNSDCMKTALKVAGYLPIIGPMINLGRNLHQMAQESSTAQEEIHVETTGSDADPAPKAKKQRFAVRCLKTAIKWSQMFTVPEEKPVGDDTVEYFSHTGSCENQKEQGVGKKHSLPIRIAIRIASFLSIFPTHKPGNLQRRDIEFIRS